MKTFFKKRNNLIGFIIFLCIIPILLLLVIFNFIKYEQTTNIKNMNIAVVNQDKPAKFKGKTVDVGKEVEKTLSKDNQVKWHFVNENNAKKNLKNGNYAMQVVLPKDFSKNATTALNKDPKVSSLEVETSNKNNYLAGMITSQVVEQMKSKVVKSIQQAYDQAALTALGQLGDGVTQASDGVKKLNNASGQLNEGSKQISDNLHVLKNGTQQLADGASPLKSGVQQLTDGSNQLDSNSPALISGANQLNSGIDQLATGSGLLNSKLAEASNQIDSQLNSNKGDLTRLSAGLKALNDGIQEMNTKVSDPANDNSAIITADLTQVGTHLTTTGNLLQDTATKLQDVNSRVYDTQNSDSVASHLQATGDSLLQLKSLMTSNSDVLRFLITHPQIMKQLNDISNVAKTNLEAAGTQLTVSGNDDMLPVKSNLASMGNELTSSGDLLKGDVTNQLTKTQENMNQLKEGINLMAQKNQAPAALSGAQQAIDTLTAGLNEVNAGLKQQGSTTDTMGGIQATQQIHDGLVQVQSGLKGKNGQLGLVPGLMTYTSGVHQVKDGLTTLNDNAPVLVSGITQLNDGAGQLATGSDKLTTGLKQAGDGISLLNVKLIDGSKQVKGLSTGSANVNHFVSPVNDKLINNTSQTSNLINVFSPLVLTLVFFVGSMLTQMSLFRYNENIKDYGLQKKIIIVSGIIIAQTIFIDFFAVIFGLQVQQPISFVMTSLLTSGVFTLTCLALDKLFGTIGLLFALALLFLQLIITGGLFPNEMLSAFYRTLATFLPGTYSISSFEQVINGNGSSLVANSIILILFGIIFFVALFGEDIKNKFSPKQPTV
ncbi:YhgE/Pip family protein [Companilactobacillus sp. DQM5]|uniref:YhgE/Pip family protein n=1 Tax=Companilactobacillus sp. DQM5 TaxID=3463359 RepID=UPI00405801F0